VDHGAGALPTALHAGSRDGGCRGRINCREGCDAPAFDSRTENGPRRGRRGPLAAT